MSGEEADTKCVRELLQCPDEVHIHVLLGSGGTTTWAVSEKDVPIEVRKDDRRRRDVQETVAHVRLWRHLYDSVRVTSSSRPATSEATSCDETKHETVKDAWHLVVACHSSHLRSDMRTQCRAAWDGAGKWDVILFASHSQVPNGESLSHAGHICAPKGESVPGSCDCRGTAQDTEFANMGTLQFSRPTSPTHSDAPPSAIRATRAVEQSAPAMCLGVQTRRVPAGLLCYAFRASILPQLLMGAYTHGTLERVPANLFALSCAHIVNKAAPPSTFVSPSRSGRAQKSTATVSATVDGGEKSQSRASEIVRTYSHPFVCLTGLPLGESTSCVKTGRILVLASPSVAPSSLSADAKTSRLEPAAEKKRDGETGGAGQTAETDSATLDARDFHLNGGRCWYVLWGVARPGACAYSRRPSLPQPVAWATSVDAFVRCGYYREAQRLLQWAATTFDADVTAQQRDFYVWDTLAHVCWHARDYDAGCYALWELFRRNQDTENGRRQLAANAARLRLNSDPRWYGDARLQTYVDRVLTSITATLSA